MRKKDKEKLDRIAEHNHFGRGEVTKNNHLKYTHESGAVLFCASTPGDNHRNEKNVTAQMRRIDKEASSK